MQNIISGTGSYIPKITMRNEDFLKRVLQRITKEAANSNEVIIKNLKP